MPKMGYISSKDKNVNSDGLILYGTNAALGLDFWNGAISVRVYPLRSDNKEGETKFDYKNKLQVTLNVEKALLLAHYIETSIIPALANKQEAAIGVSTAKVNMLYISTGVEETGKVEPYVGVFLDINENKIPARMLIYKIRPERIFTKYNKETGEFNYYDSCEDGLRAIAEFFKNSINVFGSVAHGLELNNYEKIKADDDLKNAIASKLGVTYNTTPTYVRSYGPKVDPWGDTSTTKANEGNSAEQINVSMQQLDSVDGLFSKIYNKLPLGKKAIKRVKKMIEVM
jgi:hypothetical protein